MKRLLLAALLAPTLASAQTVPPPFTTSGAVPTITQWSNAWAGKLDAGNIFNRVDAYSNPGIGFGSASNSGITGRGDDTSFVTAAGVPLVTIRTFDYGAAGSGVPSLLVAGSGALGWSGVGGNPLVGGPFDTGFLHSALGVIGQQASPHTTANAFRVYNTFTDASNGEWAGIDWQTTPNVLTIGTQNNGTGTARNLQFVSGGANKLDYGVTSGGSWTMSAGFYSAFIAPIAASTWNLGQAAQPWAVNYSNAFQSAGAQPTITGCTAGTKVGGPTAGTFQLGATCAAAATIVFTGLPAATNGYACDATNRSVPAMLAQETASTTTGFTLTVAGTSGASGNVVQWKCMGF